jgi:hypothetical protein
MIHRIPVEFMKCEGHTTPPPQKKYEDTWRVSIVIPDLLVLIALCSISLTTNKTIHLSLCCDNNYWGSCAPYVFRPSVLQNLGTDRYLFTQEETAGEAAHSYTRPFFPLPLSLSSYFHSLFCVYLFLYFSFSLFSSLMTLGIWWDFEINMAVVCMKVPTSS